MSRADAAASVSVTQVFLSYAREDRASAQALAAVLGADGHSVWWDRVLEGVSDFANEIERQLAQTRVAIVLWSAASVQSGFVRDESSRARDSGKLLPVRIEDVALPLGFGTLHTLDLLDWDGSADDEACIALRDAVKRHLSSDAALPRPLPPAPIGKARQRWRTPAAILVATAVVGAGAGLWKHNDNVVRAQKQAQEDALRLEQQRRADAEQAETLVDAGLRCADELLRSASAPAVATQSQCAIDFFVRALAKQPNLARAYYYRRRSTCGCTSRSRPTAATANTCWSARARACRPRAASNPDWMKPNGPRRSASWHRWPNSRNRKQPHSRAAHAWSWRLPRLPTTRSRRPSSPALP